MAQQVPIPPNSLPPITPAPRAVAEPVAVPDASVADRAAAVVNAPATSSTSLTIERIAELSRQVREEPGIADEARAELLKRYQAATELLQSADEAKRRIAKYEQEIQQGGAGY